jgi:hypothetical protein
MVDVTYKISDVWTPEEKLKLQELWGKHPAGVVAEKIGRSRGSVIGMANRLHLEPMRKKERLGVRLEPTNLMADRKAVLYGEDLREPVIPIQTQINFMQRFHAMRTASHPTQIRTGKLSLEAAQSEVANINAIIDTLRMTLEHREKRNAGEA